MYTMNMANHHLTRIRAHIKNTALNRKFNSTENSIQLNSLQFKVENSACFQLNWTEKLRKHTTTEHSTQIYTHSEMYH